MFPLRLKMISWTTCAQCILKKVSGKDMGCSSMKSTKTVERSRTAGPQSETMVTIAGSIDSKGVGSFFHPKPLQEQHVQLRRQPPSDQWQQVNNRRTQHNLEPKVHQPRTQQSYRNMTREATRNTSKTWCKHPENCLQGRFCVLRTEN